MSISLQNIENRVTNLEGKHGLKWFFAGRVISDESIYSNPTTRYHFSIPKSAKYVMLCGVFDRYAGVHYTMHTIDDLVNGRIMLDEMVVSLANGSHVDELDHYICRINVVGENGYDNSTFIWYAIDLYYKSIDNIKHLFKEVISYVNLLK